jgi:hypothetical protein
VTDYGTWGPVGVALLTGLALVRGFEFFRSWF